MKNGDLGRFYPSTKKPNSAEDVFLRKSDNNGGGGADFTTPDSVTYNSTDGAQIAYDSGSELALPIVPGNGISIDASADGAHLEIKVNHEDYEITGVPTSATSGTLPDDNAWNYLKTNPEYVRLYFNKEFYQLSDNQHTTGTLVFSHVGYEGSQLIVKTITITIATRAWVLTVMRPYMDTRQAAIQVLDILVYTPLFYSNMTMTTYSQYMGLFYEGIPASGVFTYGDAKYILSSISLTFDSDGHGTGGSVTCYKLSDGTEQTLQLSSTQLYIDEIVETSSIVDK